MRTSFISAAILAFASAVIAADPTPGFDPITAPFQDQNVPAGAPFDIVWDPSKDYTGTVTIQLLQGATTSTLSLGPVIKAGVENSAGTYTWNVPTSVQSFATYGFTIIKDTDTTCFQYSFPFHITGLAGSSSGSSSSGSASKSGPASTVTMHLSTGSNYIASTSTVSNTTTTSYPTVKPTSNYTLSTTLASQTSASNTQASSTSATSSSATPTTSKSAAAAQIASGSLAMIGGFVLALAL